MKISYKSKFIFLFVIFGLIIVFGTLFTSYKIESEKIKSEFFENAAAIVQTKTNQFENYLKTLNAVTTSLLVDQKTQRIIQNDSLKNILFFKEMANLLFKTNLDLLEIAIIDNNNKIVIKEDINKIVLNNSIEYSEVFALSENQTKFFINKATVNGKSMDVITILGPVYIEAKSKAVVSITADLKTLLNSMDKSPYAYINLVDENGIFIIFRDKMQEEKNIITLEHIYGEDISDDILFGDLYVGKSMYSKKLFANEENQLKLILEMRDDLIQKKKDELIKIMIILSLAVLLLSIPLAYVFSILPDKLNKQIVQKSQELADLNKNLEKRVIEEVEIRREKEKMLVHQSKMASMGEMIGAIAHQWRQPLNTLSLISMGIKDLFKTNSLTKRSLDEEIDKVDYQIQFMSKTIDDFRNFFKPDKTKEIFDCAKAIGDVITLLSSQIVKHNIKIQFSCTDKNHTYNVDLSENKNSFGDFDGYINGYPNEYKQVILNIVNNAKDIILEKEIEGEIKICVNHTDENKIRIDISDNAGGIPENIIDKIFNPYFSTKGENGTGVGLDMAKTIIETNMQGELFVANENGGAKFSIILDRAQNQDLKTISNSDIWIVDTKDEVEEDDFIYEYQEEPIDDQNNYLENFFENDFLMQTVNNSTVPDKELILKDLNSVEKNILKFNNEFKILNKKFPKIKTFSSNLDLTNNTLSTLDNIKNMI